MLQHDATATDCLPPARLVRGGAFHSSFVWNYESGLPALASVAARAPLSSPKKTSPPAVESAPPQELPGPIWGYCQTIFPVCASMARRNFLPGSSCASLVAPP